ncbi:MAG: glycosyltransferase [Actinobacteria bacterium]|nr:glycosyltransferase [Actinomycetota bacterium]
MSARPRVLVLTTTFPVVAGDPTPGFVFDLTEAMADEYDFTVLTPRVPGSPRRSRVGRIDVVRFAYFPRRWEGVADGATLPNLYAQPRRVVEIPTLMTLFMAHAWRLHRRIRPDLLHAHWLLPCGVFGAALSAAHGTPLVGTAHGVDVFAWRGQPFTSMRRVVMQRATVIGVGTKEMHREVAALGGRPWFAPMGVDVERLRRLVGTRSPVRDRFLFVGRLAEKKGAGVLVRAIAAVPDATLVVAGDGPERPQLEMLARQLDVGERVRFVGAQERMQVAQLLREAYALVVPSLVAADGDSEGTSVALSEGVAAGVPIIATRTGGPGERIRDRVDGVLAEPDDPASLSEALRWSLDHPDELAGFARQAPARLLEDCKLEDTVSAYREMYRRALRAGTDA